MAVLAAGGLLTWQMVESAKHELCANQLQQTRFVAQAINLDNLKSLTGTEADTHSPVYLQIKEQLATVCSATPQCRFVSLLGQRADGTLFSFVDSEPTDSKDCSLAGMSMSRHRKVFGASLAPGMPSAKKPTPIVVTNGSRRWFQLLIRRQSWKVWPAQRTPRQWRSRPWSSTGRTDGNGS